MTTQPVQPSSSVLIIYDGDCTFCNAYTQLLRLQQSVGVVELLSARSDDARVQYYAQRGYDLNEGMLVVTQGQVVAGAAAMHWLSHHLSGNGIFDTLHRLVFNHAWLARLLYPVLKLGRRCWLALRGKSLIAQPNKTRDLS